MIFVGLVIIAVGVILFWGSLQDFNIYLSIAGVLGIAFGLGLAVLSPILGPAYDDNCPTYYQEC